MVIVHFLLMVNTFSLSLSLSFSLYLYISLSLYLSRSLSLSLLLSFALSLFLSFFVFLSLYIYISFALYLPICLFPVISLSIILNTIIVHPKVFTSDGSAKSLLVDEKMTVGQVTRMLAEKNHVNLHPKEYYHTKLYQRILLLVLFTTN